jgi:hypothetical protein
MSDHPWLKYRAQAKAEEADLHQAIMDDVRVAQQAAEITRLRAWRDAINGYLTEAWNSPLCDDEAPLAALRRLIKLEITAMTLDPNIIQTMNAELATARRQGMEEAAKRLEELHKNHGYNPQTGEVWRLGKLVTCPLTIDHAIGYYRAIAEGVAHIRAAAGEVR